jgi:hypothetical protein
VYCVGLETLSTFGQIRGISTHSIICLVVFMLLHRPQKPYGREATQEASRLHPDRSRLHPLLRRLILPCRPRFGDTGGVKPTLAVTSSGHLLGRCRRRRRWRCPSRQMVEGKGGMQQRRGEAAISWQQAHAVGSM